MTDFGFIGQPMPQQPMGGQQDPHSQMLAQVLAQMQQPPPQAPASQGSNPLADALMKIGTMQGQSGAAARAYGASPGAYSGPDPLASLGQMLGGG